MAGEAEFLVQVRGALALVTLNRPKALNALTLDMCRQLDAQLADWAADPSVAAVLIKGAGERAFCAGGDVVAIYESGRGTVPSRRNSFAPNTASTGGFSISPSPSSR